MQKLEQFPIPNDIYAKFFCNGMLLVGIDSFDFAIFSKQRPSLFMRSFSSSLCTSSNSFFHSRILVALSWGLASSFSLQPSFLAICPIKNREMCFPTRLYMRICFSGIYSRPVKASTAAFSKLPVWAKVRPIWVKGASIFFGFFRPPSWFRTYHP